MITNGLGHGHSTCSLPGSRRATPNDLPVATAAAQGPSEAPQKKLACKCTRTCIMPLKHISSGRSPRNDMPETKEHFIKTTASSPEVRSFTPTSSNLSFLTTTHSPSHSFPPSPSIDYTSTRPLCPRHYPRRQSYILRLVAYSQPFTAVQKLHTRSTTQPTT